MRIARIDTVGGAHLASVTDGTVVDLTEADPEIWDIADLYAHPNPAEVVAELSSNAPDLELADVDLLCPLWRPSKFLAIGLNSTNHRRDVNLRWLLREPSVVLMGLGYAIAHPRRKLPYFFAKSTSSLTGPYSPIWLPREGWRTDWEGELAVIVGHHLRDATVKQAEAAIAGYTVTNDVSIRDLQLDNPTGALLAKGYDTHGPIGPWIVSPDDVDLDAAELRTYVNGRLEQRGRIADMILAPAEILSVLSRFCTMNPGDVVACGTFAGTGWPQNRFLAEGDVVRVEIDDIGAIENPVIAEPDEN